jgi:hypothetical protein
MEVVPSTFRVCSVTYIKTALSEAALLKDVPSTLRISSQLEKTAQKRSGMVGLLFFASSVPHQHPLGGHPRCRVCVTWHHVSLLTELAIPVSAASIVWSDLTV